MADPNDIKKWRSYFLGLTTDQNVLDAGKFKSLLSMLDDAKTIGYVDDVFIQKFQSYRQRRIEEVRKTPLRDPSTGQPAYKVNPQGKTVPVTGADLFAGNQFMPEAGPSGVMQARQERMAGLKTQTEADVKRLRAVSEAVAPSTVLGNLGMAGQAVTEAVRTVPTWLQIGASGIPGVGEFVAPPSPEQLAENFIQKEDWTELTPEQARLEAMKPARAGGLAFGEGALPTLGGVWGGSLGVAGVTALGLASGPAAPIAIPLAAAGGSFLGATATGAFQEMMLRRAYGDKVYDEQVKPIFQQSYKESGSAPIAGALGNVLLQGAPVLTSGIGTRRMLGLIGAAWKGAPATLMGTAEQLGAGAARASAALDAAALPNVIARSPNKYEAMVSPLLQKFGSAASKATDDYYKVFTPTQGAGFGQRQRELLDFIRQTPGAADYAADALGEQFMNVGQSAFDYVNQLREAEKTGEQPSAIEALTNLAFGSIFIGNNKFTDAVDIFGRKLGTRAMTTVEAFPGIGKAFKRLGERYQQQKDAITENILNAPAQQVVSSSTPTPRELELGVRRRLVDPTTAGGGPKGLAPDEQAFPIGGGQAVILNTKSGDARAVPYADVFGGLDDASTVELGTRMGEALGGVATQRSGKGLDKFGAFGGRDIVQQFGPNQQQIIGVSKDATSDEGHVIVREVIKVANEETGRPDSYVKVDILRVSDLEDGNKAEAEKLLKASGLKPAEFQYRNVDTLSASTALGGEVSPMSVVQAEQQNLAKVLPKEIVNQFSTIVQVEDGVQLRARVIGSEANGDVRLQLFSPSMEIIRTVPANILTDDKGRSTATVIGDPISLSDLQDEIDFSDMAVPVMDKEFDVFADPSVPIHTIKGADDVSNAVVLTEAQRQKLPGLIQRLQNGIRNYSTTTNDPAKIKAFRRREINRLLTELFGESGRPVGRRDYVPGSSVKVKGPNGDEFGVVLANTDQGTLVMLPSMDGKPVLIQDASIIKGDYSVKAEEGDGAVTRSLKEDLQDPDNVARVINAISRYIDDRGGAAPTPKEASELFGVPMEGTNFVGEKDSAVTNVVDVQQAIQFARDAPTATDAQKTEADKVLQYLSSVRAIFENGTFVPSFASASISGKSIDDYKSMVVDDVVQTGSRLGVGDRATFYIGQALRDTTEEHVARFFGLTATEKDGVNYYNLNKAKVEERATRIKDAIIAEAQKPTRDGEYRTKAREALRKIDEFLSLAQGFTYGRPPRTTAATTAAPAVDSTLSVDELKNTDLIAGIHKDGKGIRNVRGKGRFTVAQLEKYFDAVAAGDPTDDFMRVVFSFLYQNGKFIGKKADIADRYNDLASILDKVSKGDPTNKSRADALAVKLRELYDRAMQRVNDGDIKFKLRLDRNALEAEAQADAIAQSEQARDARRLNELQARAIRGAERVVFTDDGMIPILKTYTRAGKVYSKNLVQELIKKVFEKTGPLTEEQRKLAKALGFPAEDEKTEWWRNAYQGVMWLNDKEIQKAVSDVTEKTFRTDGPITIDTKIDGKDIPAGTIEALRRGGFVRADGEIDKSGIKIYGGTERGLQVGVGVLNQSIGTDPNALDIVMESLSWDFNGGGSPLSFNLLRSTNKSEFRTNLTALFAKTAQAQNRSAASIQNEIDNVVEMFDAFIHGATGRRIGMMLDALSQGAFVREAGRSGQKISVRSTRSQRKGGIEIDSYTEAELKPLYNRLRELLNLAPNVSLNEYIKNRANAEKVNVAIAKLNEEEASAFYAERIPALANYDVLPKVNGILGQYLDIYDPTNQTTTGVLMAFASADITTFVHEVAHAFFEGLPTPLKMEISSSLGHTLRVPTITHTSVLTYEAQEKFAYGLETSLANINGLRQWTGQNAGRGASQTLFDVLKNAGDAVEETYKVLLNSNAPGVYQQSGEFKRGGAAKDQYAKDWRVPYTANGRVYLWWGAPVILKDGRRGKIAQNFGTTKNPQRIVQVSIDGVNVNIENGEIAAIGSTVVGLNPSTMQILSTWVARRTKEQEGLVESTRAGREAQLRRDASGNIVGVVTSEIDFGRGEVTNDNLNAMLRAIGLNVSEVQMGVIKSYFRPEELDVILADAKRITREYARDAMGLSQNDAVVVQLTDAYARAKLMGRLNDLMVRYRNVPAMSRPVWYAQVLNAIDGGLSRDNPRKLGIFNNAKEATARVIHANRYIAGQVADQLKLIAKGEGRSNWAIKIKPDGTPVYNAQTGDVVVVQTIKKTGRRPEQVFEYKVNLNTGITTPLTPNAPMFGSVPDMVIPDTLVSEFPFRPRTKPGGTISQINAQVKDALRQAGIISDQFRVFSPEYFIAEALMKEGVNKGLFGPRVRSASFLAQSRPLIDISEDGMYGNQDATPMAQLSVEETRRIVTPKILFPELTADPSRIGIIEQALQEGNVAQAMQRTGAQTIQMNDVAKAQNEAWIQRNFAQMEAVSSQKLEDAKTKWEEQNPGQTAQLYRYEAYVMMDIFDVDRKTPWIKEDGIPDKDGEMPVRQERIKTVIFSFQDMGKMGAEKDVLYWNTDKWASYTPKEQQSTKISAVEFGRNIIVDVKSRRKVDAKKGSIAKAFAEGSQARIREISQRWSGQYNPAVDGVEAVDPTMAWLPTHFDMTAETKTVTQKDGTVISVVVPKIAVKKAAYGIDVIEGNHGWKDVNVRPIGKPRVGEDKTLKPSIKPAEVQKRLVGIDLAMQESYEKASLTSRKHQAVVYPIAFDDKGLPTKWAFRLMVRDDKFQFQFATDNNNGLGYDSLEIATEEAQNENLRLGGLARTKQEEAVSRRIADETVRILEVAREGLKQPNPKLRTKEQQNAINIVLQFTWYKSMEKRLVGTYGQFATLMADALGATSPQTPVWQNYLATMFLMQMGVGKHRRRVALQKLTAERNPQIAKMLEGTRKGEKFTDMSGAVAIIQADVKRTLIVKRIHDGLVAKFGKQTESTNNISIDNYKQVMSDIPNWSGMSWVELFEQEVPPAKRAEVLRQINEYLGPNPSRLGGESKKDIQFRSFVNEVDDWAENKGTIIRYKKGRQPQTLGVLTKDVKLTLSETIIPRNVVSGAMFGSNSQNVVLALANEWLTVAPGMSAKARNFAMNFIGLSQGATIDVWAARLTRRHLNEHFMGVQSTPQRVLLNPEEVEKGAAPVYEKDPKTDQEVTRPETLIVDQEKYNNWEKLSEEERKQYFRLMPMQEGAVKGGYVANLKDAVKAEGYFTPEGREAPVELAGEDRQYTDVRDARIDIEFGAANRIFGLATEKVNTAIGKPGFMSAADLQAVVWFAEKARWTQNGWTTAAGAGGSFEQMYNMIAYLSGGYRRGSVSVGFRDGSQMALSQEEKGYIYDLLSSPFDRERQKYFDPTIGDVQKLIPTDIGTELLSMPPVTAMTVNVMSRQEMNESVEAGVQAQISLSAMLNRGREEKIQRYEGSVPFITVSKDYIQRVALQLGGKSFVYLPVRNAKKAREELFGIGTGRRVVFSTVEAGKAQPIGSAVVDNVETIGVDDVPIDDRIDKDGFEYIQLELRSEQDNVDSSVYLYGNMGRDKKTNEWGIPLVNVPKAQQPVMDAMNGRIQQVIENDMVDIGQIKVDLIRNANKKDSVLPAPPRAAASDPGNMGAFVESSLNVLAGVRDAQDTFVSFIDTIESEDDPLYDPQSEISTVPGPNAWQKNQQIDPGNNKRYGAFLVVEAPVGQQRVIASEQRRIMDKITVAITKLRQGLPDVGFTFRLDADARDLFSNVTGNKGFPMVEIIFSPEQFIRDFNPLPELDGGLPESEKIRQQRFIDYVNGDVEAIRKGEAELVEAVRRLLDEVNDDVDLKGAFLMRAESVYIGHAIPKELLKQNGRNLEELAKAEFARRSSKDYGIADATREYAEAIGKTAVAEVTDTYYDGGATQRVANPADIVHDWNSISDYTVMAQVGFTPFRESTVSRTNTRNVQQINVVASALAGTSRLGYDSIYRSAMDDYYAGRVNDFKRKVDFIAEVAKEEFDNALEGLDVDWNASLNPSIIAGDAKPAFVGTAKVNEQDFNKVIGRAARLGNRLAQPNVFITSDAGNAEYGVSGDGSVVVPSIKLKLTRPLDPADLRLLVDTNPSVFNGANQSIDKMELEVFMVPDADFGRAEAKQWASEATDFINRFFMENNGLVEPAQPVEGIGINIKSDGKNRYADLIIDGTKKYESRATDSLRPYVGKQVGIIRTGEGQAKLIGVATIGEPIVVNESEFDSMRSEHLVPKGSDFDIAKGGTKYLYPITSPVRLDEETIVSSQGIIARKVMIPENLLSSGNVDSPEIENGKAKAVVSNARVSGAKEARLRLWNIGSAEYGGKGRFLEYEDVLSIVSAVAPDDTLPSPEKVTFRTNQRLRKEVEFALSVVYGEPVKLPTRVKFKRTQMHTQLQKSIANHLDMMPMSALKTDPHVKMAYEELTKEMEMQFKAMNLTVKFMPKKVDSDGKIVLDEEGLPEFLDPYDARAENVIRDMEENRNIYVYPTTPGSFGDSSMNWTDHPLLKESPFKTVDGEPLLWNDVLRAVHDAIAHGVYGATFGKDGEELAFATHAMITKSPWAIWALAMETRMQNSWVHFNKNNLDDLGEPMPWNVEDGSRFADQKVGLPVLEAIYTGVNQVDDRLRAFSYLLRTKYDGYNGTVEYLRKNKPDELPEQARIAEGKVAFDGMANAVTAFGDQVVVINNPKLTDKAIVDLKNGVIESALTQDDLSLVGDQISSVFSAEEMNPEQLQKAFFNDPSDLNIMAQVGGPGAPAPTTTPTPAPTVPPPLPPAGTAPIQPKVVISPLQRAILVVTRLLKSGASGDASPVLMQNFLSANILENPAMLWRQLVLQAQVLAKPNTGFQRKDGTIVNPNGMRGRKFFDETLEMEVRQRKNYSLAKDSGLTLAAITRERALDELRKTDPTATYDKLDELGYDTDAASDADWMKHLPGQGPSERFFSLSKDIVKMNQFESMVDTLISIGYTPTKFQYDADGKLIETNWTRALKDVAALLNVASGDVRFADQDDIDQKMATVAKIFLFAPRWMTSRLFLDSWGRKMFMWSAERFGESGREWGNKILSINRMNPNQIMNRDPNVSKMHVRLLGKAYLQWLALLMAIYAMRLTNPHTMQVSIEDGATKLKIGDYSFRAPGAIMTSMELTTGLIEGVSALKAVKYEEGPEKMWENVWKPVSRVLLSKASPLLSTSMEVFTGRDPFGDPAFIPDEAAKRFWAEVVSPGLKDAGITVPKDMSINTAVSKRMLWWWLRDGMETYDTDRKFGIKKADALLKAALVGAYSAEGGRVSYRPKALQWEAERNKNLEATPDGFEEWLTGAEATPIMSGDYTTPIEGADTGPVRQPLFGATDNYRTRDEKYEDYTVSTSF